MSAARSRSDAAARAAWHAMADLVLDNQRRREVSDAAGLSFGKVRALRRIARAPMTMGELATLLGVDPPNLTSIVDDLEAAGLVERRAHPSDRRAKVVAATPAGAKRAAAAERTLDAPPLGLAALPREELETLVRILSRAREGAPTRPGPTQ